MAGVQHLRYTKQQFAAPESIRVNTRCLNTGSCRSKYSAINLSRKVDPTASPRRAESSPTTTKWRQGHRNKCVSCKQPPHALGRTYRNTSPNKDNGAPQDTLPSHLSRTKSCSRVPGSTELPMVIAPSRMLVLTPAMAERQGQKRVAIGRLANSKTHKMATYVQALGTCRYTL